jgi:hypothetical protein
MESLEEQTQKEFTQEYFEESQKAWRANKRRNGQSWAYVWTKAARPPVPRRSARLAALAAAKKM